MLTKREYKSIKNKTFSSVEYKLYTPPHLLNWLLYSQKSFNFQGAKNMRLSST